MKMWMRYTPKLQLLNVVIKLFDCRFKDNLLVKRSHPKTMETKKMLLNQNKS